MNDPEWRQETSNDFKLYARWALSSLLDTVFLAFWLFLQWLLGKAINLFPPDAFDEIQVTIFRILFAITTAAPIAFYILEDIAVMYYRTRIRIRRVKRELDNVS